MSWELAGTAGVAFVGSGAATGIVQGLFKRSDSKSRLRRERVDRWIKGIEALKQFNLRDEHEQYNGPDYDRHELVWRDALDLNTQEWYADYKGEAAPEVVKLIDEQPTIWSNNDRARKIVEAVIPDIARVRRKWKV